MIIDSSALVAILENEPGAARLAEVAVAGSCRMSTATWLEASIVADSRSTAHGTRLDDLVEVLEIQLVAVSPRHAEVARAAYRRFGRGSGSSARLNFGDCFAYALSVTSGEPLLFTGDHFLHTDVEPAIR